VLIDWFTVVAQIVNFLILVFLLKHFLYGRILHAMDRREERIASHLKGARAKRQEAEAEAASYRQRNRDLEEHREAAMARAEREAEEKKKDLIEKGREEVERLRERWQDAIRQEGEGFLQELKRKAAGQILSIARQTLRDLARSDLEEQVIEVFLAQIRSLEEGQRQKIKEKFRGARNPPVVRSAFEISGDAQDRISDILRQSFGDEWEWRFEKKPEMVLGIELQVNGQKIAWSLDHYLESLEREIAAAMEEETSGGKP
jgi:F-type H+-transporting ATPase subunit b